MTTATDNLKSAISSLKPPPRLTVSEWAEKNRILSSESSAEAGKYRVSRTPYLKDVMDAMNDYRVEQIVFMKPSQVRCF